MRITVVGSRGVIIWSQYMMVTPLLKDRTAFQLDMQNEVFNANDLCKNPTLLKDSLGFRFARTAISAVLDSISKLNAASAGSWAFENISQREFHACAQRLGMTVSF